MGRVQYLPVCCQVKGHGRCKDLSEAGQQAQRTLKEPLCSWVADREVSNGLGLVAWYAVSFL